MTIKKGLKVSKHNALSGNTARGRTGPAYDGEYYTPTLRLAIWHALAGTSGLRHASARPYHLAAPSRRRAPRDVRAREKERDPPLRLGKHKRAQTAIGPSLSPSCSLETWDVPPPWGESFGIPNRSPDPLVRRVGRDHPFPISAGSFWRKRDVARRVRHG